MEGQGRAVSRVGLKQRGEGVGEGVDVVVGREGTDGLVGVMASTVRTSIIIVVVLVVLGVGMTEEVVVVVDEVLATVVEWDDGR